MMNMLLKYIPFPGKEALYSPLHTPSSTPSPRGKNSYWSRSGGGAHLCTSQSLACCFSNINVRGTHWQILIPNYWDGWDVNLHFYWALGAELAPGQGATLWSLWSACSAYVSMWACGSFQWSQLPVMRGLKLLPHPDEWALAHTHAHTLLCFLCGWSKLFFCHIVPGPGAKGLEVGVGVLLPSSTETLRQLPPVPCF